jgi:hypothetical protein
MIAILLTTALLATPAADPPPAVSFSADIERAEKGVVKAGPALRHTFTVTHTGTAGTLVLVGVEPGCGCVRYGLSKLTLQPGETSQLMIEVNTLTQAEGPNVWHATLHGRLELPHIPQAIPPTGTLVFRIAATLERDVVVTPPMIAFSTTGEANQVVRVADKRPGGALKIQRVASSSRHLTAVMRDDGTVAVSLDPAFPADGKPRQETVTLTTADPAYPEFRIPVSITKRATSGVSVSPDRFTPRFATGETTKSAVVQLRDPAGAKLQIASASCPHPGVSVTFSPGANPVAAVKVTVDRTVAGANGSAGVVVSLATPAGAGVTIPLVWSGPK